MKRQSFQKKRRPTGGGLFVFHSKTRPSRRRKQRVAAGASPDLGSEVPNLGVARALLVILVLHVAAIAAIFIHNRWTDDQAAASATEEPAAAAALGTPGREKLPVVQKGEDIYFVATGDTYQRIAELKGVDARALRDLNDNVTLKAGRILRVPAGGLVASPQAEAAVAEAAEPPAPEPAPEPAPAAELPAAVRVSPEPPASNSQVVADSASAPPIMVRRAVPAEPIRVLVENDPEEQRPVATRVSPNVPAARAVVVAAEEELADTPAPDRASTYIIKKGDTAWGISQRHKVSVDRLLEVNGIADARKLRPGMKLSIPAQ